MPDLPAVHSDTPTAPATSSSAFPVADRYAGVHTTAVRDLLDVLSQDGVISFAGGAPAAEFFAADDIRACFDWVFTHHCAKALQYSSTPGEPQLREQAARRLSRSIPTTAEHIQVTTGSQEAIYLVGHAMLNPGDTVLVERPTYLAALQAFAASGARIIGIPSDQDGARPDALEALIQQHDPQFVYLIPTFQNPSGVCMPANRRQQIADVLLRTGTPLVEDDPYGELRFAGDPIPQISALPGMAHQSLLLNSISKIMAPGIRVGWIRGEGPIMNTISIAKEALGLHSSVVDQLAVARYLEAYDVDAHIRTVASVYKTRRDAMRRKLVEIIPESATVTSPDGGMFLWAALGQGLNTTALLPLAVDEGVAFVPGESFFAHDPDRSTMRLSYVTNPPEVIDEGLQRLSRALERWYG
ncbi:MAG: PLP-dependent aminotransferase family protein [Kocuria sp.]|nr:PLP-dependent aminotransferase family protein [Kocuria sp.]